MGPKPSAPFQGKFVHNQVWALAKLNPAYHYMRWHSDSLLNKLLKYPVFLLSFIWRFVISRQRYDIAHIHFFYPTIWLALVYKFCRNKNLKIVVTCHGSDIYKYQPPSKLYRWCAKQVDQWIFASSALEQHFSLPKANSKVLAAGINESYRQAEQVAWQDKTIDLLYVGSLDENKGMDRLLAMLPYLTDKHVVIAGSGPWLSRLQTAATEFSNVLVVGPKNSSALKQLYRQSRYLLNLSRNEAFGLVMTEAMCCYTPVIASFTDGGQEQVQNGVNGVLLSATDSEQQWLANITEIIQRLWQLPPEQYQRLQQQARTSAEPYLLKNIAEQLELVYQRVVL